MKQQDRTARRLSGPVFLRRETKKNDFFSVLALSVSHCSTSYSLFLALPFSPNRRKSAKGRTLGKTGSFAVLPKPLTLRKDSPRSGRDVASATEWGMWHCGAMTERARPLTIKFYPKLTPSWFWAGQPLRDTEPAKSHSSQNLEKLPVFCRNLFLKWQL